VWCIKFMRGLRGGNFVSNRDRDSRMAFMRRPRSWHLCRRSRLHQWRAFPCAVLALDITDAARAALDTERCVNDSSQLARLGKAATGPTDWLGDTFDAQDCLNGIPGHRKGNLARAEAPSNTQPQVCPWAAASWR
jgi:hypothetical protein